MIKIISYCLVCMIFFSCNRNKEEKKNDVKNVSKKEEIEIALTKSLQNIIDEYSKIHSLNKDASLPTRQSYYVGFLRFEKDTLLTIGRQSFLYDLFPDFAFNNRTPKAPILSKGIYYYKNDMPIIIFDENTSLGNAFYSANELIKEIPEAYKIKEEFDTLIPPLWTYKINGANLYFLEKSDSLTIK